MSEGQVIKTTFGEQVSKTRAARQLFQQLKRELDKSYEKWCLINGDLIARVKQAKLDRNEIENHLRAGVVVHYQNTGNKNPHPKLGIRSPEVPIYDHAQAFKFAVDSVPDLLLLDKRAFESYAKGVRASAPLSFVEWKEKVTATIARDLEE